MKRHKKLAFMITLSLSILLIFSISVSAEKKTLESEITEEIVSTDEMDEVFKHYFTIRELLSKDRVEKVEFHAKEMSTQLDKLIEALESIKTSSSALKASNLDDARKGFGSLSQSMISYIKTFGYSGEVYGFHCPMAKGGSWLQENDQIGNPYYGSKMYKCGKMTGMIMNGKYMEKP